MKEIDETPVPENESEDLNEMIVAAIKHLGDESKAAFKHRDELIRLLRHQVGLLEIQVANLQAQRVANEYNTDDPEWH